MHHGSCKCEVQDSTSEAVRPEANSPKLLQQAPKNAHELQILPAHAQYHSPKVTLVSILDSPSPYLG